MRPLRPLLATGAAAALAGALLVPPAQAAEIDGITPTITVDTESVDYWDRFEVGVTFAVPDGASAGDTFSLTLSDELRMLTAPVDLRAPDGSLVATVVADGPTLTYTFTDYVDDHSNVTTRLSFWAEVNRDRVRQGETVSVDVTVNNTPVDGPDVSVPAGPGEGTDPEAAYKWMSWTDTTVQDRLTWGIVLTPRAEDVTTLTVTDTPGAGATVRCPAEGGTVNVYVGPDREAFTAADRVTPTTTVCAGDRLTVTLTGDPAVEAGDFVEVRGQLDVQDAAQSYSNSAQVVVDDAPAIVDEVVTERYGSSGDAQGDGSVSVGDLVWLDEDRDGRQGGDESGIPGVTLVLTGPDGGPVTDVHGNPVVPVVTDENGNYNFDDLPVLEDGQSYTVTIDDEASADALAELTPTTPGTGDREGDSSTNSASSEGLTENGDRDPTLDFGFVRETVPTPEPTDEPTDEPTAPAPTPSDDPTDEPTDEPTDKPTDEPTTKPTDEPTTEPTDEPTDDEGTQPIGPTPTPGDEPTTPAPAPGDEPTTPAPSPTETDDEGTLPRTPTPTRPGAPVATQRPTTPDRESARDSSPRPTLARTGAELGLLAGAAVTMLASGGALVLRRRRDQD